jgi:peroxiredoxin family protein
MSDTMTDTENAQTPTPPQQDKMVLIAASGDLDKAWPTLILATTGAAYGMDVTVFFTFWGLAILKRPDAGITGDDWRQRLMSVFKRGTPDGLQLSTMNFGGLGARMMKDLANEKKVASVQELLELAQEMGVKLWPCQMTMDLMGLELSDMIDGLDRPAGAGSAISLMRDANISLFI